MSNENSQHDDRGDQWVDGIAAAVLIAIVVATFVYWAASQS